MMMAEKMPKECQFYVSKWYFTREEIEDFSPSRKDNICLEKESELLKLYCLFLQELGMKLKVPRVTVACAVMLCHQFYMCKSHAKNDWQTIVTASPFLGCKIEETRCMLGDVFIMSYEIIYKRDPSAPLRIRQRRDVYKKQRELILAGETLLLATIAFDFDIQLLYKPLITVLRSFDLFRALVKVARNFVNDWESLSGLSLIFRQSNWKIFSVVIKQMLNLLELDRKQALPCRHERISQLTALAGKMNVSRLQSYLSDGSVVGKQSNHGIIAENDRVGESLASGVKYTSVDDDLPCQTSATTSSSIVEDGGGASQPRTAESAHNLAYRIISVNNTHSKMDMNRIRDALKRRRRDEAANKKFVDAIDPDIDSEAWVVGEPEKGIELEAACSRKKRVKYCEVLTS